MTTAKKIANRAAKAEKKLAKAEAKLTKAEHKMARKKAKLEMAKQRYQDAIAQVQGHREPAHQLPPSPADTPPGVTPSTP